MVAAVSVAVSLSSVKSPYLSARTSFIPPESINFNKAPLYNKNVLCVGAKVAPIRAQAATASKKQDEGVIFNKFMPDQPFISPCLKNIKITGDGAPHETHHITLSTDGELPYKEGQVIGVIPDGMPHKQDLFSIASSARGDFGDSKTLSLCVERAGVTSNFLCDLKPGAEVKITGPMTKDFLMPKDPNATILMLATRTGIAPCRSFLWKMFIEKDDDYKFKGLAWLFFGVPTISSMLYKEELLTMKQNYPHNFRLDFAVDEQQIETLIAEHGNELWELIKKDTTYVYMSGEMSMEKPMDDLMVFLAGEDGIDWLDYKKQLKAAKRWNVRVY